MLVNDVKLNKILYTITLILILIRKYVISIFWEGLVPNNFLKMLFYASIVLLFIQFLIRKKHNVSEILFFLISGILYILTKEGSILVIILLSISILDIEDKYVVKNYLILTCIFMIFSIILGIFTPEVIQTSNMHYRLVGSEYIPRQTFGFGNPNAAFFFILPIYAAYIFLRFDKYNIVDRLILLGVTLFIYKVTLSRTGLLTMIAGLIFVDLLKYIDLKKYTKLSFLIKIMPIILLLSSVIIGTLFSKNLLLNSVLASRPKYWNMYLTQEGNFLSLFGNSYSMEMKEVNPLDNSYVYLTVMLGIVSVVFFMYLLYKGLDLLIQKNENKYIAIIAMFLIYSFAENILFEAGFNFTIVFLIKYIIIDNSLKNKFRREKNVSIINNANIK